jgi:NTE family protein
VSRAAWTEVSLRAPQLFARLCERLGEQLRATTEPPRPARRTIVAYQDAGPSAPWLGELARSIRRQFPLREVHVVEPRDRPDLERTLAAIVAPDALILVAGAAEGIADRRVERRGACEWAIEPGRGARPRDVVRGTSPETSLARLARALAGGQIGLALGAGGAYGFAHLGIVRALDAAGVPIDCIAGTSMGAIVGSALAAGIPVSRLVAFAESAATRYRGVVLRDLNLRGPALLKGTAVLRLLGELAELETGTFEQLVLPFVAVAMDLATGDEVVLDRGRLLPGIAPSFAIPGILPHCVANGRTLIDGAMVNPVPVDCTRRLGADFVIAAQPIPPLHEQAADPLGGLLGRTRRMLTPWPFSRLDDVIGALDASLRSFQSLWFRMATAAALAADAAVHPDLTRFWFLGFGSAGPIIEAGERAAEAFLPELRCALDDRLGWRPAPA